MNDRQAGELKFWNNDYAQYTEEEYAVVRAYIFKSHLLKYWPEMEGLTGKGLDVGCGPVSIFEYSGLDMCAIDPLMEEYQKMFRGKKMCRPKPPTVEYVLGHEDDGSLHFADQTFDFVVCKNVIDHTERDMTLLFEMYRVLKPDGMLFFMVNFDKELHLPEHVRIWDYECIEKYVIEENDFHMERGLIEWSEEHQKHWFWGVFTKKEIASA